MTKPLPPSTVLAVIVAMLAPGVGLANSVTFSPTLTGVSGNTYAWNVSVDGGPAVHGQTLILDRGQTYTFTITGLGPNHSFWINNVDSTDPADAYTGPGLNQNGVTSASGITFDVPLKAPERLYYNCDTHASMGGVIEMAIFHDTFDR